MRITAWRIFKPKHAATAFTGEGARLHGGRWNSKGTAIVYTASSGALAALELLVHLQREQILQAYLMAEVTFDSRFVQTVKAPTLPRNWQADPAPRQLKVIGNRWAREHSSAVLQVPSAIVTVESNYLLNPAHVDFASVVLSEGRPFAFDARLLK